MIHKRNLIAARRDAEMADPPLALIERMTNRIFNSIAVLDMVDYRQFTVWAPISPGNVFENLPRRTAGKGSTGKDSSYRFQVCPVSSMEYDREFTASRDSKQV